MFVPTYTAKIVQYLQAYEWMSMLNIILVQKKKTMARIMFELNNMESHKKF